ncbi:MAG TPA: flagellar basal body rod protein FlgB [Vicinamibacterales bacterium]
MSDMSDAAVISALRREMGRAVARQVASAGNLANLETPGFRAREADFSGTLERQLGGPVVLAQTNSAHLQATPIASATAGTKEVDGLASRRDGNNVQLDRELMNMAEASGDFAKAQTALAAKFRLVRYAISEGR